MSNEEFQTEWRVPWELVFCAFVLVFLVIICRGIANDGSHPVSQEPPVETMATAS